MENQPAIYLDHNATTPLLPEVVDAMLPYLREHFGNPSSGHLFGRRARDGVARARGQVAELLGKIPVDVDALDVDLLSVAGEPGRTSADRRQQAQIEPTRSPMVA